MTVAEHSLLAPRRDRVALFLLASVGGHAFLLAVGLFVSWLRGARVIDLDQKPIRASLVRLGKPRDPKLLPRLESEPAAPKKVDEVLVPIPGAKPVDKKSPAKTQDKPQDDRRKQLFGAFDKVAGKHPPEELAGAEDGDPSGDAAEAEGERYFAMLKVQVRRHYDVSSTIPESERIRLRAQVLITIGKTGEVLETKLAKASGHDLFDSAVMAAVKKASPFSPPPDHLRDELKRNGVVIVFTP